MSANKSLSGTSTSQKQKTVEQTWSSKVRIVFALTLSAYKN